MKSFIQWLQREYLIFKFNRLFKKKKYIELISLTSDAIEGGFCFFELFTFRTWAMVETQQIDQARIVVGQALAKFPEHPVLLSLHGEVSYKLGDYDSARQSLKLAMSLSPGNLQVEYLLGLTCVAQGELDKAGDYFESILRYDPTLLHTRLLVMAESYIFQSRK